MIDPISLCSHSAYDVTSAGPYLGVTMQPQNTSGSISTCFLSFLRLLVHRKGDFSKEQTFNI